MEGYAWEEMCELDPYLARERGFGTGAEDEEADWRGIGAEAGDGWPGAGARWMKGVAEGCDMLA